MIPAPTTRPAESPSAGGALRPLRVLWLTTEARTDGPGRALVALVNRWPVAADTLAVCALRLALPLFRRELRPDIAVYDIGMRGAWDAAAFRRLARLVRMWRPDVLNTQLSRADWIGRLIGPALGVPVVSTIQNVHSRMYRAEFTPMAASIGRTLDRLTMPRAARLVAVSEGVRRDLSESGAATDRVVVIHNGIDLNRSWQPAERAGVREAWRCGPDDLVVGTVARLKEQKGLSHLIDAARLVAACDRRVRFVQIGTGPLERTVQRRIDAAGLADRVRLLGAIDDPMTVLGAMDIFVLPSLWEGFPLSLLEAMAVGLPVIGTRVSGVEDAIEEGRSGLLVAPADPNALAAAILALAGDDDRRRRLGCAARARAAVFDAARTALAYRRIYEAVSSPGKAARAH